MSTCRRCRARSISQEAAAPRSRSTRRFFAMLIACWAAANAASARCGSFFWSGSSFCFVWRWRGVKPRPAQNPPARLTAAEFVVTQAMTSLTGSAGEDFASILRALGYRMDRRPPPPPKSAVVEGPATEAAGSRPRRQSQRLRRQSREAVPTESAAEAASKPWPRALRRRWPNHRALTSPQRRRRPAKRSRYPKSRYLR